MRIASLALFLFAACATAPTTPAPTPPSTHPLPTTTPWSAAPLARTDVPAVYAQQWQKAGNRATCALIAPRSVGDEGATAKPRAATFSGGWAVAYDLPDLRSAFGVAGTGATVAGPTYKGWPDSHIWPDGSKVSYGPEGGTGPNQLAYLEIAGQGCLYNVWSRLGKEHLEELLRELRYVQ